MANSRTAKALTLASGRGLTTLVGLVSVMVLARLFTKQDYAAYRQTLLSYQVLEPFVRLGLPGALLYFLAVEKRRSRGVLTENMLMLAAGGAAISLFLAAGGSRLLAVWFDNPALALTLLVFAPYPLVVLPARAFEACLVAQNRITTAAVYNVTSRLVILAAVLVPVLLVRTLTTAVAGLTIGSVCMGLIALGLMFRACGEGPAYPTAAGMRSQLSYGIPVGLAVLVTRVGRDLDKVLVSVLCGPAVFAVYVNGAMEIPFVAVITGSVISVLVVDYVALHAEGRSDEIIRLFRTATVKCGLGLIPLMFLLFVTARDVMRILYGPAYVDSAGVFQIYLLLLPARTLTFEALLRATGNSRLILIQAVLALTVNAAVSWLAILLFGPLGAAAVTVGVVYLVQVPYNLLVLRGILGISAARLVPWSEMGKTVLCCAAGAAVTAGLGLILPQGLSSLVRVGFAAVVFGAVTAALLSFAGLLNLGKILRRLLPASPG